MLARSQHLGPFFYVNDEVGLIPIAYGAETLLQCDYHRFMYEALHAGSYW